MTLPFQKSSQFYEIIYQNKDYKSEADYLYSLLKSLHIPIAGSLLDIGCGTGGYIPWHLKQNIKLTGLDISKEMLAIAKNKFPDLEFINDNMAATVLRQKYNFAFMMFHVINYQITNDQLIAIIQNIAKYLTIGGVLLFDFWHGAAIENDPPKNIERIFEKDEFKVYRKTTPLMDTKKHLVDVCFDYTIYEGDLKVSDFQEHHIMRYLFKDELKLLLENAGFEICINNGWLKNTALSCTDWYGIIVAKKTK